MTSIERLKKAVDYLKKIDPDLSNELMSIKLGYRAKTYLSDILGGSKPINDIFLSKFQVEYSISSDWIKSGQGSMKMSPKPRNAEEINLEQQITEPLSSQAILKLIDTNNTLVEANKTLADAHYIAAENSKRLLDKIDKYESTVHSPSENLLTVQEMFSDVLDLIAQVGSGTKKWNTLKQARAELNKYVIAFEKNVSLVDTHG